jgi:hypothetical protein
MLLASIQGHRRYTVLNAYRQWKGADHVPSNVPLALHWSQSDPFELTGVLLSRERRNCGVQLDKGVDDLLQKTHNSSLINAPETARHEHSILKNKKWISNKTIADETPTKRRKSCNIQNGVSRYEML